MLHGWTLDHRSWQPQLPLADRYRLVMPDRRGFGGSTVAPGLAREWLDIDQIADDGPFLLVGHSQGATVALDYARHHPRRLSGLVLIGAPLHGVVPHDDCEEYLPLDYFAALAAAGRLGDMKAAWRDHPLAACRDGARSLLDAMLDSYDGRDLIADSDPIAIDEKDVARLPMPVLAIVGAEDTPWRRRVAQFVAEHAPSGQVAVIDAAGHLCNLDNPDKFNMILADFHASILQ